MAVITIRGQLGSGDPEIGKLTARKLGHDYVDREIIVDVAAHLKWTEKGIEKKEMPPGTLWGRIAESLAHTYPINTEGALWTPAPIWETVMDDDRYLEGLKSIIKDLAANNSIVIRGRGSQFILKDYPGALHILVLAPLELRIKRVMADQKVDEAAAGKEIERFDGSRREFTKRYFHAELEDPLNYDLVLNTLHLSYETSASMIVRVVPKEN